MARRLSAFYEDGHLACVLDTMTLAGTPDEVRERAGALARGWIDAMTAAAQRSGAGHDDAVRRGRDAFVRIEGALILSRVLDDPAEFVRILADLPHTLTGPEEER